MKPKFDVARQALDFLELHAIAPTEAHYGLALAVCEGTYPDLNRAINEEIDGGVRLTVDTVMRLRAAYLEPSRDARLDSREMAVAAHSTQLGALTNDAHDLAATLQSDVSVMANEAEDWPQSANLVQRLDRAESELTLLKRDFLKLYSEIQQINAANAEDRHARSDQQRVQLATAIAEEHGKNRTFILLLFRVDQIEDIKSKHGDEVVGNVLKAFMATITDAFDGECRILPIDRDIAVIVNNKAASVARDEADTAVFHFAKRRFKLRGTGEWIGQVTASAGMEVSTSHHPDIVQAAYDKLESASNDGGDRVTY